MKEFSNITKTQIAQRGVQALANRPNTQTQYGVGGLSPGALKLWFDKLATFLADKINEIHVALSSADAADYICIDESKRSLADLISGFKNGEFANELMLSPSAAITELESLQDIINSTAQYISDIKESIEKLHCSINISTENNTLTFVIYNENNEELTRLPVNLWDVLKDTFANYALKNDISSVYRYKGTITKKEELPTTDVETGDTYNVQEDGVNYAAIVNNGVIEWDSLRGIVDLSPFFTKTEAENKLDKASTVTELQQVYVKDKDGKQTLVNVISPNTSARGGAIPRYWSAGSLPVGSPTAPYHATDKQYVDALHAEHEERMQMLELNIETSVTENLIKTIVEAHTDGKFTPIADNKLGNSSGDGYIALLDASGTKSLRKFCSGTHIGNYTIPYRMPGGVICVGTATGDTHAVPLKQLNDINSATNARIDTLRDITKTIDVDAFVGAVKEVYYTNFIEVPHYTISENASMVNTALLNYVGGSSIRYYSHFNRFAPKSIAGSYNVYGEFFTLTETSNGRLSGTGSIGMANDVNWQYVQVYGDVYLPAGTWFISSNYESNLIDWGTQSVTLDSPATVRFFVVLEPRHFEVSEDNSYAYLKRDIEVLICDVQNAEYVKPEITYSIKHSTTSAISSKDASGTQVDNISIPSAVRTQEGYGVGIDEEHYNYLEWKDGKVFFVKNCEKIVLNGTEAWELNGGSVSSGDREFFVYKIPNTSVDSPKFISNVSISDFFETVDLTGSNTVIGLEAYVSTARSCFCIGIRPENVVNMNLTKWKEHLSEYPVTVYLALETPEIIDVTEHFEAFDDFKTIKVVEGGSITFSPKTIEKIPSAFSWWKEKEV